MVKKTYTYLIGIDEAGRGPVAGPVALGGVCVRKDRVNTLRGIFKTIRGKDSKRLTEKQREYWYMVITEQSKLGNLVFFVAMSSSSIIDNKGIVFGIKSAMKRVLKKIAPSPSEVRVLLDGSLYAPAKYVNQETIIKGDESEMVISLASIVAKVERDKKMIKLADVFPLYGFDRHKGYGTKKHYEMIKRYGLISEHRATFLGKIRKWGGKRKD